MPIDLVLHDHTSQLLRAYLHQPSHALLILGADGIGKGAIVKNIGAQLLSVRDMKKLDNNPGWKHLTADDKQTISIEEVRKLQQFVRLKTTGKGLIRRVIAVEHVDRMSVEAQNAFLKLLEEPPADTAIVLTVGQVHSLLPTIRSRVQMLTVTTPTKAQLLEHFSDYPEQHVTQAYFLSGGLPGLMTALLQGDESHPLVQSVVLAKQMLQQTLFERLAQIETLAKQKESAIGLCDALARIAQAGLQQAAGKQDTKKIGQWHRILKQTYLAKGSFEANANTKMILTNLVLQL